MINTLNAIPLLGRMLELIGLLGIGIFGVKRLLWQSERQRFLADLSDQTSRILDRAQAPTSVTTESKNQPQTPEVESSVNAPRETTGSTSTAIDIEDQFEEQALWASFSFGTSTFEKK